jgi:hypothetical protein
MLEKERVRACSPFHSIQSQSLSIQASNIVQIQYVHIRFLLLQQTAEAIGCGEIKHQEEGEEEEENHSHSTSWFTVERTPEEASLACLNYKCGLVVQSRAPVNECEPGRALMGAERRSGQELPEPERSWPGLSRCNSVIRMDIPSRHLGSWDHGRPATGLVIGSRQT